MDEAVGFRHAGHLQFRPVPVDVLLQAQGEHSGKANLSQVPAEIKVGKYFGSAQAGVHPFVKMTFHPWQRLRYFFGCSVVIRSEETLFIVEFDVAIGIPQTALKLAFGANEQATGARQIAG